MPDGNEFQMSDAATGNVRRPTVVIFWHNLWTKCGRPKAGVVAESAPVLHIIIVQFVYTRVPYNEAEFKGIVDAG